MTSNRIASIPAVAFLVLSISAVAHRAADPCKLLSTSDASTALGEESRPGIPDTYQGCLWSHDSPAKDTSRKIYVNVHNTVSYNAAKHTSITTIKIEPISGLGDDAFYALYPKNDPFIWVKKGDQSISIRILTPHPKVTFTEDQAKAKLLVLAKTAVTKM